MTDQTWSDSNIEQLAREIGRQGDGSRVQAGVHNALLGMRDDYERRIAKLEAQLEQAQTTTDEAYEEISQAYREGLVDGHEWEPVEEEKIESPTPGDNRYMIASVINEDGDHGLTISDAENRRGMAMPLPDDIRLCRRTHSNEASE